MPNTIVGASWDLCEWVDRCMCICLFQKGAFCRNDVGSIAFSDHMNIRNNFYKIIFFPKMVGNVPPEPPFLLDPPYKTQNKGSQNHANMDVLTSAKVW